MKYVFENGEFIIHDPELGLDFQEKIETGNIIALKRDDGTTYMQSSYKNDRLHGPSYTYFTNGQKASETWFVNGLKTGHAHEYSENGTMTAYRAYNQNVPIGTWKKWYPCQTILLSLPFENGKVHGTVELYHTDGYPIRNTEFDQGRRHGIDSSWTDDGFLIFCEAWANGERDRSILDDFFLKSLFPKAKTK